MAEVQLGNQPVALRGTGTSHFTKPGHLDQHLFPGKGLKSRRFSLQPARQAVPHSAPVRWPIRARKPPRIEIQVEKVERFIVSNYQCDAPENGFMRLLPASILELVGALRAKRFH